MVYKKHYQVFFSRGAKKDLEKLDIHVQKFLVQSLDKRIKTPDPMLGSAKLVGYKNLFRHRFGDYRIIFSKDSNGVAIILSVLAVQHRKDVYKNL